MTKDENPYYMPASREEELYIQLENQRIKKIPRNCITYGNVFYTLTSIAIHYLHLSIAQPKCLGVVSLVGSK